MTAVPGRSRDAEGLTAAQRAVAECAAALRGQRCRVCGDPATTGITPTGTPAFSRLRLGGRPQARTRALAAITEWRCARHAPHGRPRQADGLTALERASAECDEAAHGHACTVCGQQATTGVAPPGGISMARLRLGERAADRATILAAVTDWRCPRHAPTGRPRRQGGLAGAQFGRALVACYLRDRGCAAPGCTAHASTALTPAGLPTLDELAHGSRLDTAAASLAAAIPYCRPHLAAATARRPDHAQAMDQAVAALGGPAALLRALTRAETISGLCQLLGADWQAVEDGCRATGIDPVRVLAHCNGVLAAEPPPPHRRLTDAERVRRRGGPLRMLTALALATSEADLARRLGCATGGGSRASVVDGYAALGVDVATCLRQRCKRA